MTNTLSINQYSIYQCDLHYNPLTTSPSPADNYIDIICTDFYLPSTKYSTERPSTSNLSMNMCNAFIRSECRGWKENSSNFKTKGRCCFTYDYSTQLTWQNKRKSDKILFKIQKSSCGRWTIEGSLKQQWDILVFNTFWPASFHDIWEKLSTNLS